MSNRLTISVAVASVLFLSGCGILPRSGPSVGAMVQSQAVDVVNVTPNMAASLETQLLVTEQTDVARALIALQGPAINPALTFAPGDSLSITLWSFSPWSSDNASSMTQPNGPAPSALGTFVVATDGSISLPYVGSVYVAGLSLIQAQNLIAKLYQSQKIVQSPSVTINAVSIPQGGIIVTGAIGDPKVIPWTPAGVTLASAITETLGNGTETLSQSSDLSVSKSAIQVEVVRGSQSPVVLPLAVAIEQTIALQPNDKIIVTKAPAVEATVLGDGVNKNGVFGYAQPPTLSEVLADSSGLDGYVANDHAVFVMRRRPGQKPVLYDFAWNDVDGMVAAQQFPILNRDTIYVSEAPIVPVEKVISILFQIAVPAQVLK